MNSSQTDITAIAGAGSPFWFDKASHVGVTHLRRPADIVVSPTLVLKGYLLTRATTTRIDVERILPHIVDASRRPAQMTTAKAITKVHEDSGLTWEQLGRVFGVSRRAVHMWATGSRVNATNTEMLLRFVDLVDQMEGAPEERRTALLAIGSDGLSVLDRFRTEYLDARAETQPRPESLLGALHGDVAE